MRAALCVLILLVLGGCGDDSAPASDDGQSTASSTTRAQPVTCESGKHLQAFTFDETNAGSTSARGAAEVALADRTSVSAADLEGPVTVGVFTVFTYRSDGKVQVRVTVEDAGGSWRVQRLEGCPPFVGEG
jgi:hypothetical protein